MLDGSAQLQPIEAEARTWRTPSPQHLPAVRGLLTRWLEAEGFNFYLTMMLTGAQHQGVDGPPLDTARELAQQERRRVGGGLYWVSPAMTQLAVHAGRKLPHRELYPHDLPTENGFMVFGEPLSAYRSTHGEQVEIVAASWGQWAGPRSGRVRWDAGGVWLTFYAHLPHRVYHGPTRQVAAELGVSMAPLLPENEAGWPFGQLTNPSVPAGTTAEWAQTVCAAWLLMQQPLTSTTSVRAPAPAKPRLRRARVSTDGVQVIHVRQRERRAAAGQGRGEPEPGREHSHQWWVTGHWRRYHVGPGRERVERRYIADHLAGPDDKPVKGTERVRVWDR